MQYQPGFPKTMVSPAYRPAVISDAAIGTAESYAGQPARFLPQMVHTPEEEEDMRARGYLNPGEAPPQAHYAEYPKILRHPAHSPAVKASQRSVVVRNKDTGESEIKIVDVPAAEEQFPDKTVASAAEEDYWRGEGWAPAGEWDSEAFERAGSVPEVAYDPQEWPKWVPTGEVDKNGKPIAVLMEDPDEVPAAERARQASEYPKWVHGRRVETAAQEASLANGTDPALELGTSGAGPYVPANRDEAVLERGNWGDVGAVPGGPTAPQPVLDVAALKAEILGELVPTIREVIREALGPPMPTQGHMTDKQVEAMYGPAPWITPAMITEESLAGVQVNDVVLPAKRKRSLTPEQRKAIGERFAKGRAAAKERREAETENG